MLRGEVQDRRLAAVSELTRITGDVLSGDMHAGAAAGMNTTTLETAALSLAHARGGLPPEVVALIEAIIEPHTGILLGTPEALAVLRWAGGGGFLHRALDGFFVASAGEEDLHRPPTASEVCELLGEEDADPDDYPAPETRSRRPRWLRRSRGWGQRCPSRCWGWRRRRSSCTACPRAPSSRARW